MAMKKITNERVNICKNEQIILKIYSKLPDFKQMAVKNGL
jgi:hypothetical protein